MRMILKKIRVSSEGNGLVDEVNVARSFLVWRFKKHSTYFLGLMYITKNALNTKPKIHIRRTKRTTRTLGTLVLWYLVTLGTLKAFYLTIICSKLDRMLLYFFKLDSDDGVGWRCVAMLVLTVIITTVMRHDSHTTTQSNIMHILACMLMMRVKC